MIGPNAFQGGSVHAAPLTVHWWPQQVQNNGPSNRPAPLAGLASLASPWLTLWGWEFAEAEGNYGVPMVGPFLDGFVLTDQAGTLELQYTPDTNGFASPWRTVFSWAIVAGTALLVQGFRLPGTNLRLVLTNTAGAAQTYLEFDFLNRSL